MQISDFVEFAFHAICNQMSGKDVSKLADNNDVDVV